MHEPGHAGVSRGPRQQGSALDGDPVLGRSVGAHWVHRGDDRISALDDRGREVRVAKVAHVLAQPVDRGCRTCSAHHRAYGPAPLGYGGAHPRPDETISPGHDDHGGRGISSRGGHGVTLP